MKILKRLWAAPERTTTPSASAPRLEAAAEAPNTSYSTDRPIRSAGEDRFARAPFAARIADTIAGRKDVSSLVLGLYGPWGDGKSSVLHMLEERLAAQSNVIVITFNPWHFTSEEQLIRGFFTTVADAMGKNLTTRGERVGEVMKRYGGLLSIASASFGGMVSINPGQAAKDFGESLSTTTLQDLKERIEEGLSEAGKRIVVLIDDIDRLDRTETHAIFKLVKLSAGFNYTTYILAFDADVVAAALGERYGEGGYAAGRAFLEKIIQVPLRLPPADADALRRLAYEGVDQALTQAGIHLDRSDVDVFTVQFSTGLELQLKTPRQARLYSNALMFSLPLVDGEVKIVEFMLIEGLRIFYPKLYDAIRGDPALWIGPERQRGEDRATRVAWVVAHSTPDLTESERGMLTNGLLPYLFPRTSGTTFGADWETSWAAEKRVCSQQYFKRFFAYGVPPDDISDRSIHDLAENAPGLDPVLRQERLRDLLQVSAKTVVKKLLQRQTSLSPEQSDAMIHALIPLGALLPVERGLYESGGTRMRAAILISKLLRNVSDPAVRAASARDVIRYAEPLPFASESLTWLQPARDEQATDQLLSAEVLNELQATLATRIRVADAVEPLYRQYGSDAKTLYWVWETDNADELRNRLREQLAGQPDEVEAFLGIYVGEAWGMTDGLPRPADLRREVYDDIATRADPNVLLKALKSRYGAELDNPVFHHDDKAPLARRVAHQFAVIHAAALETNGTTEPPT